MNLLKCYLIKNDCYKTGQKITPKGVMVHSTGANNPTLRRYVQPVVGQENYDELRKLIGKNLYNNHWNTPKPGGQSVCVHGFIGMLADGTVGTVQTLPWDMRGWHAGGEANNTHISFEICEDNLTDPAYFADVYREAVELAAYLCREYGLDPMADGVVICHAEGARRGLASNHGDVENWFPKRGKTMDDFRRDVRAEMDAVESPGEPDPAPELYRVRKSWADVSSQLGAYKVLDNARKACPEGYTVYDSAGRAVYTPEAAYTLTAFIRDVQAACGANVDGMAGPETLGKTVTVSAARHSTHAVVRPLQRRLAALGYDQVGEADGVAGPKFTAAVKAFQTDNGCIVDGEITAGQQTWRKLLGME